MKYSPTQYAEALYGALLGKTGKSYTITLRNFIGILRKNKDYKSLNTILTRYEKIFLKKQGLKKIEVESASALSAEVRQKIEEVSGGSVLLQEKINPELLAGLRILINDSTLIDASASTKIQKVFS